MNDLQIIYCQNYSKNILKSLQQLSKVTGSPCCFKQDFAIVIAPLNSSMNMSGNSLIRTLFSSWLKLQTHILSTLLQSVQLMYAKNNRVIQNQSSHLNIFLKHIQKNIFRNCFIRKYCFFQIRKIMKYHYVFYSIYFSVSNLNNYFSNNKTNNRCVSAELKNLQVFRRSAKKKY